MPLMTSAQYVESLAKMKRNIWFQGKKIEDPITGKLAQLMGFKPYTPLDFYPGVQVPMKKTEEK